MVSFCSFCALCLPNLYDDIFFTCFHIDVSASLPVSNKKIKTNEVDLKRRSLGKSKVQVEEVEVEACDESLYDPKASIFL